METTNSDLSWQERPFAELVRLSWPITLSTLSYSVMTLVDTLLVSRLGPAQIAGVGLGGVMCFTLLCFSIGLMRAAKTLVSQAVGANRREEIGAYLGAAMGSAAAIGLVSAALGVAASLLMPYLSATQTAGEAARSYLWIRMLGAPIVLFQVALREVRYGQGDARSPMVATILANLVNICLAYSFINHLKWGVPGAAVATVIAQAVEAAILVWVQHQAGWEVWRVRTDHVRALWKMGLPTGIQFLLEVISFAILTALIARLSEVEMAAHQIAIQVIHFSFLPPMAISEAATVMVGQAVGANRDDLVGRIGRQALGISTVYTLACTLVYAFGAELILAGFNPSAELLRVGVRLLHVAAIFQIFDGANMVARGTLRGTGDVKYSALIGVLTAWFMTPPLTWLLGYKAGLGALGGWIGLSGEIILGALILWWRVERGGWRPFAEKSRRTIASQAQSAA